MVEAGNSGYQDTVDRFVSGQDVTDATLRQAWQNTTIANFLWERPIYEQFVRAVRDVNFSRANKKRLRLLLGDPPIDWNAVRTADDLVKWLLERDASAVNVIRDQVLAKRHRALVIYGEGHFWRHHAGEGVRLLLSEPANHDRSSTLRRSDRRCPLPWLADDNDVVNVTCGIVRR